MFNPKKKKKKKLKNKQKMDIETTLTYYSVNGTKQQIEKIRERRDLAI